MACAASSTAVFSQTPTTRVRVRVRSSFPKSPSSMAAASFPSLSQTLTISSNFNPLCHSSPRSFSLQRPRSAKRTFAVRAGEVHLVGNAAPDFEAETVFDQEFINIIAFSDRHREFEKLNTETLGVSVDSVRAMGYIFSSTIPNVRLGQLKF